jgi:predicted enzyme related to lactoylglutathione lyase
MKKMADHMIRTHGAFSWFELGTTDVEGAKQFYSTLLGWDFTSMGPDMGGIYEVVNLNGVGIGGIHPKQEMAPAPMWGTVISVDDVEASAEKVQQLGGNVIVPPTEIPGVGKFSLVQDPQGAVFSIITYA